MKTRIAVIGTGVMGSNHLRVYSKLKGVKIVAVADSNFLSAQQAAVEYKCNAYSTVGELLANEELDAVSVTVPTKLHFEIAMQVINAGIPLLVEKPITFRVIDAHKLIIYARRKNVLLMAGHVERFNPVVTTTKHFLKTGSLGHTVSYLFRRIGLFPARVKDINVIQDIGVHDIDLVHYLSGKKPRLKGASAGSAFIEGRYDYSQMLFEVNGASAVLECNWITPTRVREFYIVGDKGMLKGDLYKQTLEFYPTIVKRDANYNVAQMLPAVKSKKIPVKKIEPLKLELEHFIQSVKNKKPPSVTPEDAAFAVEMANDVTNSLMKRYTIKKITRLLHIPDKITNKIIKQE